MPIVHVEMWEGRSLEQKRESVYIVIQDVKKENWGAGGRLCSDKYP